MITNDTRAHSLAHSWYTMACLLDDPNDEIAPTHAACVVATHEHGGPEGILAQKKVANR